jgi:hypothetical protein
LQAGGRRFDPVWLHQTEGHDLTRDGPAHRDPAHHDPVLGGSGWPLLFGTCCLARMIAGVGSFRSASVSAQAPGARLIPRRGGAPRERLRWKWRAVLAAALAIARFARPQ